MTLPVVSMVAQEHLKATVVSNSAPVLKKMRTVSNTTKPGGPDWMRYKRGGIRTYLCVG